MRMQIFWADTQHFEPTGGLIHPVPVERRVAMSAIIDTIEKRPSFRLPIERALLRGAGGGELDGRACRAYRADRDRPRVGRNEGC